MSLTVIPTSSPRGFPPSSSSPRTPGSKRFAVPPRATLANTPLTSLPYYTSSQVALHNLSSDCWVSLHSQVLDLTPLLSAHPASLTAPLLRFAGSDLSFLFDPSTRAPRTALSPVSGLPVYSTPYGPYPHIPPQYPSTTYRTDYALAWWEDPALVIGRLSLRSVHVSVVNTLTGQAEAMEVGVEESVGEVRRRWLALQGEGVGRPSAEVVDGPYRCYVWKRGGVAMRLDGTLEENGVRDERAEMEELGINASDYVPVIHVHYEEELVE